MRSIFQVILHLFLENISSQNKKLNRLFLPQSMDKRWKRTNQKDLMKKNASIWILWQKEQLHFNMIVDSYAR